MLSGPYSILQELASDMISEVLLVLLTTLPRYEMS